jgi:hypothetical protein
MRSLAERDHVSDDQFSGNPLRSIVRAAVAVGRARIDRSINAGQLAARDWPFDPEAAWLTRAPTSPMTLAGTPSLTQVALAVLPLLVPFSAGAQLFQLGLSLAWGPGASAFIVPSLIPSGGGAAFVGEAKPKPVIMGATGGARLDPHKIAGIVVVSSEAFAQPSIEQLMQQMLGESAGQALDAVLFSNAAGTADHPPGLLNGITPLTASAQTDLFEAMIQDITALGAAVAPVSGASPLVFIANAAQALGLATRLYASLNYRVLISAQVPPGTVIAVAANAIVSIFGLPEFTTATQATLHMSDTPLPIIDGAGTAAAPVSSLFQTASIGIKINQPVTWALRSPTAIAAVTGVAW